MKDYEVALQANRSSNYDNDFMSTPKEADDVHNPFPYPIRFMRGLGYSPERAMWLLNKHVREPIMRDLERRYVEGCDEFKQAWFPQMYMLLGLVRFQLSANFRYGWKSECVDDDELSKEVDHVGRLLMTTK